MSYFDSNGIQIHYKDVGSGEPILLIHGFASNIYMNWEFPGWIDFLVNNGRRVIAIDNRGHGSSTKLYDPNDYGAPLMAEDACRLLDHLKIKSTNVMGYSMGARIAAFLTMNFADRVKRVIFGGLGYSMITGGLDSTLIIEALEIDNVSEITDQTGLAFRKFADKTGSDRIALAACMRSSRQKIKPAEIGKIVVPVLIAVGTRDDIAGSAKKLAELIPNAKVLEILNRDHQQAVGDKIYQQGTLKFLEDGY